MFPLRVLAAAVVATALAASVEAQAPQTISVTSPTLKAGETIPQDYTADGRNVSPPLQWSGAPASTKEFAVILDDPDVPMPPAVRALGDLQDPRPRRRGCRRTSRSTRPRPCPTEIAGAVQGTSGFRRPIYRGPAPPPGKPHHYHFKVLAIDAVLDLKPGLTKAELLEAIKGHIVGEGELVAIYERKPPQ